MVAFKSRFFNREEHGEVLGILAFETARTMSRLISIYKSLSSKEISVLFHEVFKSDGVSYLNSRNQQFLMELARAEKIEDLDRSANAISRLSKKCNEATLLGFEHVYADMKLGLVNPDRWVFREKEMERKIKKMERYIAGTLDLYAEMEALHEMEVSDKKRKLWMDHNGNMTPEQKANNDFFEKKLKWRINHVKHLKENSLWGQSFDKIVGLLTRIVYSIFARIRQVFYRDGAVSSGNSSIHPNRSLILASEPLHRRIKKDVLIINSGPIYQKLRNGFDGFHRRGQVAVAPEFIGFDNEVRLCTNHRPQDKGHPWNKKPVKASLETLGDAGLALRYANIIIHLERILNVPEMADESSRKGLYDMLPTCLRSSVKKNMRNRRKGGVLTEEIVEDLKKTAEGILKWLAPVAHDTIRWQTDRNIEQVKFESKPTVLLLQTLHYSDKEKTDAAIAEVLGCLNRILQFENQRNWSEEESATPFIAPLSPFLLSI